MNPGLSGYLALLPEISLLILLVAVLAYDRTRAPDDRRRVGLLAAWGFGIILAITFGLWLFADEPGSAPAILWGGMLRHDTIALVFRVMFLIAAMIVSLIAMDIKSLQSGEFYALMVTSTLGFNLMAASGDLIMLFIALETASISLYVMGGYATGSKLSTEAGMKYFIYGAFASAVMMYGMSLLYGLTGETGLLEIAFALQVGGIDGLGVLLASVLVLVGFGFKISVVPFHFWAPDVYEGAPTAVTAYLSTASKAAGFAVLMRVLMGGVLGSVAGTNPWWAMLVAICIVTMTLGNFLAIFQSNIKRLLAYSSIAQAGYMLIGVVTLSSDGSGATMFYLLMYIFTNVAAFGVVILASNATGSEALEDLSGLSRRSPFLALAMLFALLSLGGIPPTAGFFGKFFLFKAAIDEGLWLLAAIGILNAFVALYYYLSVAKYMYLYRSEEEEEPIAVSRAAKVALAASVFGVLYLGIFAGPAFEWTREAARFFFPG
jgi:NADH-quinone oxidoreductase subunit N